MESNLDKLRKLLQDSSDQPLPPELDWANMKDGIFDKIHSIEQTKGSTPGNGFSIRRSSLIISLLLMSTIGLICFTRHSIVEQNANMVEPIIAPRSEFQDQSTENPSRSGSSELHVGSEKFIAVENGNSLTKNTSPGNNHPATDPFAKGSTIPPSRKNKRIGNSVTDQDAVQINNVPQSRKNETTILEPHGESGHSALLGISTFLSTKEGNRGLPLLPTIHADKIVSNASDPGIQPDQPMSDRNAELKQPVRSHDQILLEGGLALWNPGYGQNKPENANYETTLPSFQFQATLSKAVKHDYFLMAGVQFQQLESKFEYNQTINDYKLILEDTIVQVQNNLLTGQQTVIHGNVERLVKAERRIRHYNRTQLVKTSLGVGKSWRSEMIQTDIYLGGSLNGLVTNTGRTIDGGSIIDYAGTGSPIYQNQWTVEAFIGSRVHYFLTPGLGLTAGLQCQKAIMNWRTNKDVHSFPLSFGLQFGLSYTLP